MTRNKGFTLIEVMIVLVIIATMAFIGTSLLTNTFRSKARELSWRMASTVKYLFNSAVTENKTNRLVLDFENNTYWAEGTSEKFLLETPEEQEKTKKLKEELEKNKDKEESKNVEGETSESGEEAASSAPATLPLEPTFGSIETPLLETKKLPNGVMFKDVYTSHDNEPISGGRAYIYFFQNGSAESAIINFKDEADEKQLSIKINPFTGDVDIEPEYRKLESGNK